jgi:hypothetical protein
MAEDGADIPKTSVIDKLPQNKATLETRSFVGQRSALRLINFKDRTDMQRYRDINRTLPEEFVNTHIPEGNLIGEVYYNRPGKKGYRSEEWYFGVAGSKGVSDTEMGELQGWVSIYPEDSIDNLVAKGYLPETAKNDLVLEVSFARHPNAAPLQMASALRQVCTQVSQINAVLNKDSQVSKPTIPVTAYVKPDNIDSVTLMKAAGFEEKGEIEFIEESENKVYQYKVFILDWSKLNEKMHQAADEEILTKRDIKSPTSKT